MIVVMQHQASKQSVDNVLDRLSKAGFQLHISEGVSRTVIGVIGENTKERLAGMAVEAMPGVEKVVPILHPFKLAGRDLKPEQSRIQVGDLVIGGKEIHVMAGPCAVENEEQLLSVAHGVKKAGATILRGGAYKPRTSPYSFQGLEEEGLKLLAKARRETGLKIVTEVTGVEFVSIVTEYADILQVGARNMQNFQLLKAVGKTNKPVLLKRGACATFEEWILAAEYIMAEGNFNVIFCERGIRTFENYTRNTLDISSVPVLKHLTHLPVIVDPSHGTGKWHLVTPMALAAVAAGADGLMVEVHPAPSEALSDGPQSLTLDNFLSLMEQVRAVAHAVNRQLEKQ
ncbi:MAG: 3-deoxy-7-phosphoheptulonate synthase [Clostridia bacterium]|jgi:3-deoxy-7-phosphoheptulonate synthase|nr:3-deoxy-7-phosphoheptulonate synthase [Clostridia bacterium]